jgi:hypothetical protein
MWIRRTSYFVKAILAKSGYVKSLSRSSLPALIEINSALRAQAYTNTNAAVFFRCDACATKQIDLLSVREVPLRHDEMKRKFDAAAGRLPRQRHRSS